MGNTVTANFSPSNRTKWLGVVPLLSLGTTLTGVSYIAIRSSPGEAQPPTISNAHGTILGAWSTLVLLGCLAVPVSSYFDRRSLPFPYKKSAKGLEKLGIVLFNIGENLVWNNLLRRSRQCTFGRSPTKSAVAREAKLQRIVDRVNKPLAAVGIKATVVPSRWHRAAHWYPKLLERSGLWPRYCKKPCRLEFHISEPQKLLSALRAIVIPRQPAFRRDPQLFVHYITALIDQENLPKHGSVLDTKTLIPNPRVVIFPEAEMFQPLLVQELARLRTELAQVW